VSGLTDEQVEEIAGKWAVPCGPCDLGVDTVGCACPEGDPRPVIAKLLAEIGRLRYLLTPRTKHDAMPMEAARALMGREVIVTVQREKLEQYGVGATAGLPIEYRGVLHALTEDGEVTLVGENGVRAYCWPLLEIRPA